MQRYLDGELSLPDFNDWFVLATARVEHLNEPRAEDLTWDIYLRVAEFDHGDWTETQLKNLFRTMMARSPVTVGS